MQMPLPGAVWPAIVTFSSLIVSLRTRVIMPLMSKTTTRGSVSTSMAYLRVPGTGVSELP